MKLSNRTNYESVIAESRGLIKRNMNSAKKISEFISCIRSRSDGTQEVIYKTHSSFMYKAIFEKNTFKTQKLDDLSVAEFKKKEPKKLHEIWFEKTIISTLNP